jgi:hypothetical protein
MYLFFEGGKEMTEKRLSRRRFLQWSTMAGTGAILAACVPQQAPTVPQATATTEQKAAVAPTSTVAPSKPVTLTWWSFPLGLPEAEWPHGKWEGQLCEKYTKEVDPNVTIEFQPLGWDAQEKVVTALSTGTPPNLYGRSGFGWDTFAKKGNCAIVVELEQDLKDDLPKGWLDGMRSRDGNNYWVPWFAGATGPLLNMTIVKEAKAEDLVPKLPTRSWELGAWLELLKKCTYKRQDGTQVYGTVVWTQTSVLAGHWGHMVPLWNAGGEFVHYNPSNKKFEFPLADKAGVAYLKLMQDLYFVHKVVPDPRGVDVNKFGDYWTANQCAYGQWGSIANARVQGAKVDPQTLVVTDPTGFEWTFVQNPTAPGVSHATWGGPRLDSNLQPLKTDNPDAVPATLKFAHWVVNRDNQAFLAKYMIPIRQSVVDKMTDDPLLQYIFKAWVPGARVRDGGGCNPQEVDIWDKMWQKLYLPTDPEQVAKEAADKLSALTCYTAG